MRRSHFVEYPGLYIRFPFLPENHAENALYQITKLTQVRKYMISDPLPAKHLEHELIMKITLKKSN
ncbi:hypothetical protein ABF55_18350 [Enterobacter asburiae]|nr:hypothetical protein ABF55_18350 [Enterobacter asburiae]